MSISCFNSCSPATAILRKFGTNTGLREKTMETHGKIMKRTGRKVIIQKETGMSYHEK